MSIEVKNVFKYFGEQAAVKDISFSVNKGEIVGFLGPNGAGKSTTMRMITGFLPVSSGEIYVKLIIYKHNKRSAIFQKTILCMLICMSKNTLSLLVEYTKFPI